MDTVLSEAQKTKLLILLRTYLTSEEGYHGIPTFSERRLFNSKRFEAIKKVGPTIDDFCAARITISRFADYLNGFVVLNDLWGFRDRQRLMYLKGAIRKNHEGLEDSFRKVITCPKTHEEAREKLDVFDNEILKGGAYVCWLYLISFFWHIHDANVYPACHTSSWNVLIHEGVVKSDNICADYSAYHIAYLELASCFMNLHKDLYHRDYRGNDVLYHVEHALYRDFRARNGVSNP